MKTVAESQPMIQKFLSFSAERHRVFLRRQKGLPQEEWTNDLILKQNRFCNAYRVLDRGSQFFIKEMLADQPDQYTTLARAAMYRMTNEPKFWKLYISEIGLPSLEDMKDGTLDYAMLWAHESRGINIFRPSYMLSFGVESVGQKKHEIAPKHFFDHFHPEGSAYVGKRFFQANSMFGRMVALEKASRVGPFLAQQIVTDVNYSQHHLDNENYRVVGGPGSRKGLQYLFGADAVGQDYYNTNYQLLIQRLQGMLNVDPLELPGGGERKLSLMDVQNCLCEFSKYVKLAGQVAKDPLKAAASTKQFKALRPMEIELPAHWVNEVYTP